MKKSVCYRLLFETWFLVMTNIFITNYRFKEDICTGSYFWNRNTQEDIPYLFFCNTKIHGEGVLGILGDKPSHGGNATITRSRDVAVDGDSVIVIMKVFEGVTLDAL